MEGEGEVEVEGSCHKNPDAGVDGVVVVVVGAW
jgi:hypothetical protein